jgi:hypothetical protein
MLFCRLFADFTVVNLDKQTSQSISESLTAALFPFSNLGFYLRYVLLDWLQNRLYVEPAKVLKELFPLSQARPACFALPLVMSAQYLAHYSQVLNYLDKSVPC